MALSAKQIRAFRESTAPVNIAEGAVRSGKTVVWLLRWLDYVASAPRRGELTIIGKTLQTAYRNVLSPLMDPDFVGSAVARAVEYTPGASMCTILGRRIHVIGGNDAKAEPKIRGLTGAGSLVEELTTLPEDFFNQLVARQSVPGAQIFASTNPDSPAHWVRTKWLTGNPNVRSWHFTLDDNPFLTAAFIRQLKSSYSGLWYRRFILGHWVAAEGAIYDMLDLDRHVIPAAQVPFITHWIGAGIDHGTTNPLHAVMLAVGVDRRLYIVDEYRHDSRKALRQMTDAEYSTAIRGWLDQIPIPGTELVGVDPSYMVVDPSATGFRVQLHRDGMPSWPANNTVLDGISTMSTLLGSGQLLISDACPELIAEMSGYSWDPKAQLLGEDKPLKVADHGPDAARYIVKTTEGVWRTLIA
jgi:PBSX family phage terminase large subunit